MRIYMVVWSGGYEDPIYRAGVDYGRIKEYFDKCMNEMSYADGHVVEMLEVNPADGSVNVVESSNALEV